MHRTFERGGVVLVAWVLSCAKAGGENARQGTGASQVEPAPLLVGERVVIESAAATFAEGVVSALERERAKIQVLPAGKAVEHPVSEVYVPGRATRRPAPGGFAVCHMPDGRWRGCRVDAIEGERAKVTGVTTPFGSRSVATNSGCPPPSPSSTCGSGSSRARNDAPSGTAPSRRFSPHRSRVEAEGQRQGGGPQGRAVDGGAAQGALCGPRRASPGTTTGGRPWSISRACLPSPPWTSHPPSEATCSRTRWRVPGPGPSCAWSRPARSRWSWPTRRGHLAAGAARRAADGSRNGRRVADGAHRGAVTGSRRVQTSASARPDVSRSSARSDRVRAVAQTRLSATRRPRTREASSLAWGSKSLHVEPRAAGIERGHHVRAAAVGHLDLHGLERDGVEREHLGVRRRTPR